MLHPKVKSSTWSTGQRQQLLQLLGRACSERAAACHLPQPETKQQRCRVCSSIQQPYEGDVLFIVWFSLQRFCVLTRSHLLRLLTASKSHM